MLELLLLTAIQASPKTAIKANEVTSLAVLGEICQRQRIHITSWDGAIKQRVVRNSGRRDDNSGLGRENRSCFTVSGHSLGRSRCNRGERSLAGGPSRCVYGSRCVDHRRLRLSFPRRTGNAALVGSGSPHETRVRLPVSTPPACAHRRPQDAIACPKVDRELKRQDSTPSCSANR
jgi:hypothetical protein